VRSAKRINNISAPIYCYGCNDDLDKSVIVS